MIHTFYTYLWLREDGTPYYVGKGHDKRAFTGHSHTVKCPKDTSRILVQEFPSEETAFAAEKFLIDFYGRLDLGTGCLRNLTIGGEGVVGRPHTEEEKRRVSISLTGKPKTPEHNRKVAIANTGKHPNEETRKKMSESAKRRCTPQWRIRQSEIMRKCSLRGWETRRKGGKNE